MRNIAIGLALLVAIITLGFAFVAKEALNQPESDTQPVLSINGASFFLEVADSAEERRQGLSGREALALENGLLFVFSTTALHGIWMKDMRFPIDVVWFDEELRVVGVKERFSPDSYPETARPQAPARYILEISAGLVDEFNIKIGDRAELHDVRGL